MILTSLKQPRQMSVTAEYNAEVLPLPERPAAMTFRPGIDAMCSKRLCLNRIFPPAGGLTIACSFLAGILSLFKDLMRKAPLTGITSAALDSCLVRNPPFTGALVEVTSLSGGGGGSYDDSEVRALIATNSSALSGKHPTITVQDSAGASHAGVTTLSCAGGTVSGTTLTLPVQAGPQGAQGPQGLQGATGPAGADGSDGAT